MNATSVIAIFDIGKTNKKFFLINESYQIVLEKAVQFDEIVDEDGDACDDIMALSKWVQATLADALLLQEFDIKAINFSTYGASFVYIDAAGKVIAPLYNYLKAYPAELNTLFYETYGDAQEIARLTASPVLGSLNSGLQLYRMKHLQPNLYQQVAFALHLPQYISYLINKNAVSDITSIGCHTQLWNFEAKSYHEWVKQEAIDRILAPIVPSDKAVAAQFNNKVLQVGTGLHDSSSALIPYLSCFHEPFILISTGTWCISLNPFNHIPLTDTELQQDCLCYMTYKGNPVKASRLFAGYEHEQQTKRLAAYFNLPVNYFKQVKYDAAIVQSLSKIITINHANHITNEGLESSVFASRELSLFANYEQAYHCLIADIMQLQVRSTQMVIQNTGVKRIFVDGGFGNNPIYMHLLAAAFPNMEVYAASVAQATAMGAALAIHDYWNTLPQPRDIIELKFYA